MHRRPISRPRGAMSRALGALGLLAVAVLAACTEDLDSSEACPLLCPPQSIVLRDTIVEGVAYDTSLAGFPGIGLESRLLLAQSGDSLDTRVIVRFDQLPRTFRAGGTDSAIARVDTATLSFRLSYPLLVTPLPIEVEVYNVDTTATDTLPETLLPLFRPDRLIGTTLLSPPSVPDSTLRIFLDTGVVARAVRDSAHVRVGLRLRAGTSGRVQLFSVESGATPTLTLRVSRDTNVTPISVSPSSSTPANIPFPPNQLRDYLLVARQAPAAPGSALVMGGLRGNRTLMRFDIPAYIADSATVVRATLEMTQFPYRGAGSGDSVSVYAYSVLGTEVITDLRRVFDLLGGVGPDSLALVASDSGSRTIEIAGLVQQWRASGVTGSQRSLVLRAPSEQERSAELRFFSREAPEALRPRLRLVYVPRTTFGQP